MDAWMEASMEMDAWMQCGWVDGCMVDGWMEGWMHGGCMEEWMHGVDASCQHTFSPLKSLQG